jgi:hypothetical protein
MTYISRLAEFSGGEVLYSGDQGRLDVYGSDTAIRLVYQFVKDSKLMVSSKCKGYHLLIS